MASEVALRLADKPDHCTCPPVSAIDAVPELPELPECAGGLAFEAPCVCVRTGPLR